MGIRSALIILVAAAAATCEAAHESATAMQQRLKAAFLYKFVAYVEWPPKAFPEATSPIVIGVAGADEVARELERAAVGRSPEGRPIEVVQVDRGTDVASCCQVLFVGDRARSYAAELLAGAQGHPVLTVTEVAGDPPRGSVINFLTVEDRVRFDISRPAAERNGIQLRSQLLGVARRVTPLT